MNSFPTVLVPEDTRSISEARGERLEILRKMAGLTRKAFEDKYGISANTIQSWESAKAGGLTERGAQRIIPLLQREGIYCTIDWLLYGSGSHPQLANPHFFEVNETPAKYHLSEDMVIMKELLAFKKLNENSIDFEVNDDGLAPHYKPGDYVAGISRSKEAISALIGMDCIVQIGNNEMLLRRIKGSQFPGYYELMCTNPTTIVAKPMLYEQELLCAAPVIWHRRRNPD
ncbi:MAG TPA: helix-turn-helix transcriptional regulator [Gammaproteobacteria bacterium]|nr:helix-turn-helix transcriptional regulator [Gammaproteobacteria bacterium]